MALLKENLDETKKANEPKESGASPTTDDSKMIAIGQLTTNLT